MKITLEFSNAERFMKEFPQFAKVIGFAANSVTFSHIDKDGRDIEIQADVPEVIDTPDGKKIKKSDEDRILEAAKKVGAFKEVAPAESSESPQDAPKESDGKSSTETTKAPEKKKTEASAKSENVMPKPVDPPKGTPDIAAVRKVLHTAIKAGHKDEMKALLGKLGAQSVSTLDPSKFTEFITEANKIGGGDNA